MTENEANQSAEEQEKKVQSEIEETLAGAGIPYPQRRFKICSV